MDTSITAGLLRTARLIGMGAVCVGLLSCPLPARANDDHYPGIQVTYDASGTVHQQASMADCFGSNYDCFYGSPTDDETTSWDAFYPRIGLFMPGQLPGGDLIGGSVTAGVGNQTFALHDHTISNYEIKKGSTYHADCQSDFVLDAANAPDLTMTIDTVPLGASSLKLHVPAPTTPLATSPPTALACYYAGPNGGYAYEFPSFPVAPLVTAVQSIPVSALSGSGPISRRVTSTDPDVPQLPADCTADAQQQEGRSQVSSCQRQASWSGTLKITPDCGSVNYTQHLFSDTQEQTLYPGQPLSYTNAPVAIPGIGIHSSLAWIDGGEIDWQTTVGQNSRHQAPFVLVPPPDCLPQFVSHGTIAFTINLQPNCEGSVCGDAPVAILGEHETFNIVAPLPPRQGKHAADASASQATSSVQAGSVVTTSYTPQGDFTEHVIQGETQIQVGTGPADTITAGHGVSVINGQITPTDDLPAAQRALLSTTLQPPVITVLKVTALKLRGARHLRARPRLGFRLDQAATVTVLLRKGRRLLRRIPLAGVAGLNRTGLGSVQAGRYTVEVDAVAGTRIGVADTAFRIAPRHRRHHR